LKRSNVLAAVAAVQTVANARLAAALDRETRAKLDLAAANGELTRSRAAVQGRYELAVEAIKTFHTGVSEDFLLKQEQFKDVRDRILKSASDFYGKLGALLGNESDLVSRRALWEANYEVPELTGKFGKPADALAAHRKALAAREALAAESPADPEIKGEVARSLTAVAGLLETTGQTKEADAAAWPAARRATQPARRPTPAGRWRSTTACHRDRAWNGSRAPAVMPPWRAWPDATARASRPLTPPRRR